MSIAIICVKNFIKGNYKKDDPLASITFLRDALEYLNSRHESLNENHAIDALLLDYVDHMEDKVEHQ